MKETESEEASEMDEAFFWGFNMACLIFVVAFFVVTFWGARRRALKRTGEDRKGKKQRYA